MNGTEQEILVARVLSNVEIVNILPNYYLIQKDIERIREYAAKDKTRRVHNIFSILGTRGTGKSSILQTIECWLEKSDSNIVMDCIEPEMISEGGSMLGCVLSLLDAKMKELFKRLKKKELPENIKSDYFQQCIFKERNPLSIKMAELMECYLFLEKEYRQVLIQNYTDLNTYVKKSSEILSADVMFRIRFEEYIDKYVSALKDMQGGMSNEEPLVFFFFDDIDLCPEKTDELVEIINRYMNHPNLVCFMSGDMELIENELRWSFYQKNGNDKIELWEEEEKSEFYKSKRTLAAKYIEKILPLPMRYHLQKWSNDKKPYFIFNAGDDQNEVKLTLGELLSESTDKQESTAIRDFFSYQTRNIDNEGGKTEFFVEAFSMFSEQARGLSYVFYELLQLRDDMNGNRMQTLLETIWDQIQEYGQSKELSEYITFTYSGEKSHIAINNAQVMEYLKTIGDDENATVTLIGHEFKYPYLPVLFFFLLACQILQVKGGLRDSIVMVLYENILTSDFLKDSKCRAELEKSYVKDLLSRSKLFFGFEFIKFVYEESKKEENEVDTKRMLEFFYDVAVKFQLPVNEKSILTYLLGDIKRCLLIEKIKELNISLDSRKENEENIFERQFSALLLEQKGKNITEEKKAMGRRKEILYSIWKNFFTERYNYVEQKKLLYGELNETTLLELIKENCSMEMKEKLIDEDYKKQISKMQKYSQDYQKSTVDLMNTIYIQQNLIQFDLVPDEENLKFPIMFYSCLSLEKREFLFGIHCDRYILVRKYLDCVSDYQKIQKLGEWVSEAEYTSNKS